MAGNPIFSAAPKNFVATPPVTNPVAPIISSAASAMAGPQCNLLWAANVDEVLSHPTTPNETLYFGCSGDDPIIWVRETDANGKIKNPLHKLSYSISEEAFGPEAQFVTKEEHQKLYDLVNSVNQKLDSFNSRIEELLK